MRREIPDFVPVAEGTFALKATREMIIRRIQLGLLQGRMIAGRWYIARAELEAAAGNQPSTKTA